MYSTYRLPHTFDPSSLCRPRLSARRLLIPRRCDPWIKNSFTHDIYSVYSSSISKTIYTLLVEQVTISNGVTAGWAVTKTNTNSDYGVLWRLHAHAQCLFSRISARAWRMPLPLRHSASEQLKTIIAHARACARYAFRRILDWVESGTTTAPPFAVHNAHNQDERQLVERSSLIWHFSNKDCLIC